MFDVEVNLLDCTREKDRLQTKNEELKQLQLKTFTFRNCHSSCIVDDIFA